MSRYSALVAFLLLFPGDSLPAQQASGGLPAGERAAELARVIQLGDRTGMHTFVERRYAPEFRESVPLEDHLRDLSRLHDWTGGVDVVSIEPIGPSLFSVRLRERLTGWTRSLRLGLEAEPPHRITSVGTGGAEPPAGMPAGVLSAADLARETEGLVRALCEADVFSGAVLVARGEEVLYRHACGEADKGFDVPNTPETRLNLGSMNKMFTAVAIAQLVEAGRLSFDDPLSKYLPDFPTPGAAEKIRIEHLLTHTSGLASYFTEEWERASRARFRTVDDYLALVAGKPLHFEPGSRASYSNTGFLVLGKVVEVASGQTYFDYVQEHIFRPAGMERSCYCELDRVNENLAVGYEKEYTDEGIRFRNNIFEHVIRGGPAGGGYSTAGDLVRFAEALESGALVSPEMVETLTSPKPEVHPDLTAYGYGFIARRGGRSFGHNGGFTGISAELEVFRDRGYAVAVLSNYGAVGGELAARIRTLVLQGWKGGRSSGPG